MNNYWIRLSIDIIIVFVSAMLLSFLPNLIPNLLGDTYCTEIKGYHANGISQAYGPHYHWGWRHYIYFTMSIVLFIVQTFRLNDKYECGPAEWKKKIDK